MVLLLAALSGLSRVEQQRELRWAGDLQGGEPYVFRDPRDPSKLVGFEVELAAALAKELHVRAVFVQNEWSNLVPSLERGDFDVILNGLEDTAQLRGRILLSKPYFNFAEQLVVRRGFPQRHLDQLDGHRVGTLSSSLAHAILRAHPRIETILYGGQEEPYRDLQLGRIDAVLLDSIIATRYGLTKPDLELADPDVARGTYVMGVRKGDETLLDALNAALDKVRSSGQLAAIDARWHLPELPDAPAQEASEDLPQAQMDRGQLWLFLRGAGVTLFVSFLAMALAVPLGLTLALLRMYGGRFSSFAAHAYVEAFRGTPVLLQLYILYYGIAPIVHLSALAAAILGLGMNYGAYEAEVHRAALQSIPIGQSEAAAALGLSRGQSLRLVLLPQALHTALPAMTNDLIALLKDSSLVSVITVVELTKQMTITAVDVRSWAVPGALCALLYFVMSYPLARLAGRLEARLAA
ncbi:MAG TPA: ABC transporter substrate-binding protein/permease [Myxococcales bacterium]|jgi:polar amino acid transport system substrate-binding protein